MHFVNKTDIENWLHKPLSCLVCNLIKEGKFQMNMVKIQNSSNIAEIGYDGPTQILRVRFLNGGLYQFANVPVVLHMQLMAAKSKGHYFAKHVKNNANFPCTQITALEEQVDGRAQRATQQCSQACSEGRHEDCTETLSTCNCTFRGRHATMRAYANTPGEVVVSKNVGHAVINKDQHE